MNDIYSNLDTDEVTNITSDVVVDVMQFVKDSIFHIEFSIFDYDDNSIDDVKTYKCSNITELKKYLNDNQPIGIHSAVIRKLENNKTYVIARICKLQKPLKGVKNEDI